MSLNFNIHGINTTEGGGGGEVKNQNKTITENGVYTADSGYTGLGRVSVNVETTEPTLASLTVTPSTTAQTITPPSGTDGYNTVSVNAVTASIDSDIVAENIKKDVEILGVTGTYEGITPSGTITITSNGTTDVTNYASAEVNVSGGGGSTVKRGDWVVPTEFLNLDELTETALQTFAQENPDYTTYAVGCYFDSDKLADFNYKVKLGNNPYTNYRFITALDSTGLNYDTTNKWVDIDAQNPYIICIHFATSATQKGEMYWIIPPASGINYQIGLPLNCNALKYITYDYIEGTQTTSARFSDLAGSSFSLFPQLKSIHSINNKKIDLGYSYFPAFQNFEYVMPVSYCNYQGFYDTSSKTPFESFSRLPNLPDGYDFSSLTTDWDFTLNTVLSGGLYSYSTPRLCRMYVTLPKANVKLCTYNEGLSGQVVNNYSQAGIVLTGDNWQYIAEHAPTVSGKTLTIGARNIANAGGATGTIISMLTSKGWTVN